MASIKRQLFGDVLVFDLGDEQSKNLATVALGGRQHPTSVLANCGLPGPGSDTPSRPMKGGASAGDRPGRSVEHQLPGPVELAEWVKFLAIQCPECEGPEGDRGTRFILPESRCGAYDRRSGRTRCAQP